MLRNSGNSQISQGFCRRKCCYLAKRQVSSVLVKADWYSSSVSSGSFIWFFLFWFSVKVPGVLGRFRVVPGRFRVGSGWFRVGSGWFRVGSGWFRQVPGGSGRFRVGSAFYIHPWCIVCSDALSEHNKACDVSIYGLLGKVTGLKFSLRCDRCKLNYN